jgi:hypothetical protein
MSLRRLSSPSVPKIPSVYTCCIDSFWGRTARRGLHQSSPMLQFRLGSLCRFWSRMHEHKNVIKYRWAFDVREKSCSCSCKNEAPRARLRFRQSPSEISIGEQQSKRCKICHCCSQRPLPTYVVCLPRVRNTDYSNQLQVPSSLLGLVW